MKNLEIEDKVMITTSALELISHEMAIVELEPGCIWTGLLDKGMRTGVAFTGPSRFAVDAIAETDVGAMGRSFSGRLGGIQFYVGDTKAIEGISSDAREQQVAAFGFNSISEFLKEVARARDEYAGEHSKTDFERRDGQIFLGKDEEDIEVILVVRERELIFVYDKNVFVIGENGLVSVSGDGVAVTNYDGKTITVTKDGIAGIDGLRDIGPRISRSVGHAMKDLKKLKKLKHIDYSYPRSAGYWDDIDDLDWHDDE
ncbi:MAG: hypothetical protein JSW61_00760 [Candidatus Thorarchaeota archaeon]|nr:MAG: hypothetical protein JSW61_00760 [Candidatus Thorarchaeota archaeon]